LHYTLNNFTLIPTYRCPPSSSLWCRFVSKNRHKLKDKNKVLFLFIFQYVVYHEKLHMFTAWQQKPRRKNGKFFFFCLFERMTVLAGNTACSYISIMWHSYPYLTMRNADNWPIYNSWLIWVVFLADFSAFGLIVSGFSLTFWEEFDYLHQIAEASRK
jgi:hypothetical protein